MKIFKSAWNEINLPILFLMVILAFSLPAYGQNTFSLQAEVMEGGASLDFGSVSSLSPDGTPMSDSASRQIRLIVATDVNKPYAIQQIVMREALNPEGQACPPEAIRFSVILEQGKGTVRTLHPLPLGSGEQEIFLSDPSGEPAQLLIQYDLVVPPGQQAGRYRTSISYRVVTL